jgi:hypothetical protein
VWQWGYRENEATGEEESVATPYRVRFSDAPIVSVSACGRTYAAVDRLGFVYMWGVMPQPDDIVQTTSSSHSPTVTEVFVRKLTQERYVDRPIRLDSAMDHFIVDVAVGSQFAALLTDDGRVLAFGEHPAHGRGIDDFLYSITSTFDASVVRPPHQLDLSTGKPDTRALAISCDRAWTQVLTEEGEVHYLGGDFTYLARRLALPDGMRARRMFPDFVVCDTAAVVRNDPAGRYSRFAQLARASESQSLDDYMRQCREERRVKLNEEWSVMSPTHKIELREKQEKLGPVSSAGATSGASDMKTAWCAKHFGQLQPPETPLVPTSRRHASTTCFTSKVNINSNLNNHQQQARVVAPQMSTLLRPEFRQLPIHTTHSYCNCFCGASDSRQPSSKDVSGSTNR